MVPQLPLTSSSRAIAAPKQKKNTVLEEDGRGNWDTSFRSNYFSNCQHLGEVFFSTEAFYIFLYLFHYWRIFCRSWNYTFYLITNIMIKIKFRLARWNSSSKFKLKIKLFKQNETEAKSNAKWNSSKKKRKMKLFAALTRPKPAFMGKISR